ncbi:MULTISPECIES: PH domain-containing protein [Actinomadura]|uniref:PH domain-containing protein n=1 Tax=Actinomadura yumaensis TaxID=111807 RepID=A0ABW2CV40_9ACTN|nr:PH domain-containing protein [Actinomadura sp. J1-007]MWK36060.1 PH domain-containing protein [Actinomadura sp. J1-007]
MTPQLTIRSTAARVTAYAWLAFALLNLLDLGVGITGSARYDLTSATVAALLLLGSGIAYVIGLRPAIVADEAGVAVRNPLRDVRVPWRAVKEVTGDTAVSVRFAGPGGAELRTRAWVLQTSPRAQAKAEARARRDAAETGRAAMAAQVRGRTPTAYAAQQITEIGERHRPAAETAKTAKTAKAATDGDGADGDGAETGRVSWSVPAVAALAVPAALVVVLIVVAAVG